MKFDAVAVIMVLKRVDSLDFDFGAHKVQKCRSKG